MTSTRDRVGERVRRPRVDRRQAIIDAAVALASEKPFEEIAVAEVAQRAGVSHGLLFYYFGDKWGVTVEALRQLLEELDERQRPRAGETDPRSRMEGFVRRHVEFLRERAASYLALVHGAALAQPAVRDLVTAARRTGVVAIAEVVGLPTPLGPMDELALTSWIATLDVCVEHVLTRSDLDPDLVVTWCVDRLFETVGPTG